MADLVGQRSPGGPDEVGGGAGVAEAGEEVADLGRAQGGAVLEDRPEALRVTRDGVVAWIGGDGAVGGERLFYRGIRLAAWQDRSLGGLNALEQAFLSASRERDARERTARRRVRQALASLTAAPLITSSLAAFAFVQADRAADQRDLAQSRELPASRTNS